MSSCLCRGLSGTQPRRAGPNHDDIGMEMPLVVVAFGAARVDPPQSGRLSKQRLVERPQPLVVKGLVVESHGKEPVKQTVDRQDIEAKGWNDVLG